jgi:hypothetical protein
VSVVLQNWRLKCWKRFDHSYNGEEKAANAASSSYGIDTNWYITSNLHKIAVKESTMVVIMCTLHLEQV